MKNYKVAIVGCGMIFNSAHLPSIENLHGRMEIVAVCDERSDAAEFTAKKIGVPFFTDPDEMLKNVDFDILVNCTPNAFHKPLTLWGLKNGKDVICEKPIALSLSDIDEILAVAKENNVRFYPTQTGRFTGSNQTLKKWIKDGVLGNVYFIDLDLVRRRGIPTWGQFHIREKNLAGAFADICVHHVDALLDYLGDPKFISARTRMSSPIVAQREDVLGNAKDSGAFGGDVYLPRKGFKVEDMDVEEFTTGILCFENNITVNFRCSWVLNLPERSVTRISGDKGGVELPSMTLYKPVGGFQSVIHPAVVDDTENAVSDWGHWECYKAILRDMDGEEAYPVTIQQMRETALVLEAVYASAAQDREITAEELLK